MKREKRVSMDHRQSFEAVATNTAMLVPHAAYAGAYAKGENSPYLPL
jgi:hypothetical protein